MRQDDPKYKLAAKIRNPERRLRAFTAYCQTKKVCEHTGGPQPTFRLEHGSMKILAEFKAVKSEDAEEAGMDSMEKKQVGVGLGGVGSGGEWKWINLLREKRAGRIDGGGWDVRRMGWAEQCGSGMGGVGRES